MQDFAQLVETPRGKFHYVHSSPTLGWGHFVNIIKVQDGESNSKDPIDPTMMAKDGSLVQLQHRLFACVLIRNILVVDLI